MLSVVFLSTTNNLLSRNDLQFHTRLTATSSFAAETSFLSPQSIHRDNHKFVLHAFDRAFDARALRTE